MLSRPAQIRNPFEIGELVRHILSFVPVDRASFDPAVLRTSRAFYDALLPRMYETVDLIGTRSRLMAFVELIGRHHDLIVVRQLKIRHLLLDMG